MYAERIDRMLAEGLLTETQADALRRSLAPLGRNPDRPPRRASRLALVVGLTGLAAILLALVIAGLFAPGVDPGTDIQDVSETLNAAGGTGAMSRTFSALTSAALLSLPLILIVAAFAWFYNRIVDKEERVYEAWSQVESNLQRRADLVPNLVEIVSRYMRYERETLTGVTAQRADALNPLADAMNRLITDQQRAAEDAGAAPDDEEALSRLAETQRVLAGSLRSLLAVAESYPNLRSGDQFLSLQAQLEGTENRINVARMEFNRSVGDYNSAIRRLPGTLIAGVGDFKRKAYFDAEESASGAPELEFAAD